jgi:hypothetical protein
MKTISFFSKILIYSLFLSTITFCTKKQNIVPKDSNYEVNPEILLPANWALVETNQPFDIIVDFIPYNDDSVVEIIQTKFLHPEDGEELDLIYSEYIMHHGVYNYTGTATAFENGIVVLGVCSYKDEVFHQGPYSFFSYNGECNYRHLFAQDKVGTDFQVKTQLVTPLRHISIMQNDSIPIKYEYEIIKGASGILSLDILDENDLVITNLLETEITENGNGQLTYQFNEQGNFSIRLKAEQSDGSDKNFWTTKITVN